MLPGNWTLLLFRVSGAFGEVRRGQWNGTDVAIKVGSLQPGACGVYHMLLEITALASVYNMLGVVATMFIVVSS